ncbi:MAG: PaaX family transcriptional regulator [Gammaproteobacteria bacterium]
MTSTAQIERELHQYVIENPPKAGSLIITLFGDVISQHGNSVWLGSIIEGLAHFGLNARQIRTAISRLVQEDWLQSMQRGRRSYYSFTTSGQRRFERVANRIYAPTAPQWDEKWTVVLLSLLESTDRDQFRKELSWQGFGQVNHGVFVHPSANEDVLKELIDDFDAADSIVVMRAMTSEITSRAALEGLTYKAWKLSEIQPRFERFCKFFSRMTVAVEAPEANIGGRLKFMLRVLLIHEYRRLLLKMPTLPHELLPKSLPVQHASEIAASLYDMTKKQSCAFISDSFERIDGPLPLASNSFYARFS